MGVVNLLRLAVAASDLKMLETQLEASANYIYESQVRKDLITVYLLGSRKAVCRFTASRLI